MRFLAFLRCSIGVCVCACTATPLPEAPAAPSPDLIDTESGTSMNAFVGEAGSVDPDVIVRVWSLGDTIPPQDTRADDEGAFAIQPTGAGPFRFEALDDEGNRSAPLDLDGEANVLRADECLRMATQLALEIDNADVISIENGCGAPVDLMVEFRAPAPIEVSTAMVRVANDDSIDLSVRATEAAEEILRVQVSGAITETRAVTVFTVSP